MKKRILIVEDNPSAFMAGKILFEMLGCDVVHAENGEDALELFTQSIHNQTPYSAIYMDIGLPCMSGIDTCVAIRQFEAGAHLPPVPVIAVTANVDNSIIEQCLSAGMMDVFDKPLTKSKASDFLSKCQL